MNVTGDDLGNFHYGYVGTGAAFSRFWLLSGGHVQSLITKYDLDEPRDQQMINWGIDRWHLDFGHPFRLYL